MLFEQLKSQKDFTPSEKVIADAILNGAVKVETLSTTELARATHTSKATVTRFCQKLGLGSYREFQQMLEKERALPVLCGCPLPWRVSCLHSALLPGEWYLG